MRNGVPVQDSRGEERPPGRPTSCGNTDITISSPAIPNYQPGIRRPIIASAVRAVNSSWLRTGSIYEDRCKGETVGRRQMLGYSGVRFDNSARTSFWKVKYDGQ